MVYLLCILKIDGDIKHLNSFVDFNKLVSGFESENMLDHNLEIPIPVVFGVKCFNCDTTKLYLEDNIEVVN